jgi:hypothetical protein
MSWTSFLLGVLIGGFVCFAVAFFLGVIIGSLSQEGKEKKEINIYSPTGDDSWYQEMIDNENRMN